MSTIKLVVMSALADKTAVLDPSNRFVKMALNQLTDEVSLIPEITEKPKMVQIIQLKRHIEEQGCDQYIEMDQEELAELSVAKDTILSELAEIIRQLE